MDIPTLFLLPDHKLSAVLNQMQADDLDRIVKEWEVDLGTFFVPGPEAMDEIRDAIYGRRRELLVRNMLERRLCRFRKLEENHAPEIFLEKERNLIARGFLEAQPRDIAYVMRNHEAAWADFKREDPPSLRLVGKEEPEGPGGETRR